MQYDLREEKNYQPDLDAGSLEFQFIRPREYLTKLFRTLSFCFGVMGKIPDIISRNLFFLSTSAIAIMYWQDVTRTSLCSGVKE